MTGKKLAMRKLKVTYYIMLLFRVSGGCHCECCDRKQQEACHPQCAVESCLFLSSHIESLNKFLLLILGL